MYVKHVIICRIQRKRMSNYSSFDRNSERWLYLHKYGPDAALMSFEEAEVYLIGPH